MPAHPQGKSKNATISFPPVLLERAQLRARRLNVFFAQYIQKLVDDDLRKGGPLMFHEQDAPDVSAQLNLKKSVAKKPNTRKRERRHAS